MSWADIKKNLQHIPKPKDDEELVLQEREPTEDELALGYAEGDEIMGIPPVLKGVAQADRAMHFYVMGGSGRGKSSFLEYLIRQDIDHGRGFGLLDPHANLFKRIKAYIALNGEDVENRVVVIDPTDEKEIVCFNPLELTGKIEADYQAEQLVAAFKKIWGQAWGDRMAWIFQNTLIALSEKGQTLNEVRDILKNAALRKKLTRNLKNHECRRFFEDFETWGKREQTEQTKSTLDKVSQFLGNSMLRQMFISPKSTFDFREIMDSGKILLVNLDKGQMPHTSGLLGSILMSKIQMAAFSRSDTPEDELKPFHLYIDEFQNFADENFTTILDEGRKYKMPMTLAHQYLSQLNPKLKGSIMANCGLHAFFHMNRPDAEQLAKEAYAGIFGEMPPWEQLIQKLQSFVQRQFLFKHSNIGGIAELEVPKILPVWEEQGQSEREFMEFVQKQNIGGDYLRKRTDIEREYQTREQTLFAKEKEPPSYWEDTPAA